MPETFLIDIRAHLLTAIYAALQAGNAVLDIYHGDFSVETKEDRSPLTLADTKSHEIIVSRLSSAGLPVLSEEGTSIEYVERKEWEYFWIIDPLDGTKEFINKNGEFTINIALVLHHHPVLGVIYIPVSGCLYFAADQMGAYRLRLDSNDPMIDASMDDRIRNAGRIHVDQSFKRPFTIVGSRSHATPELKDFVDKKRREYGNVEFISSGSSIKFCRVAEGSADIYPRLGTTMEWDTAAGHLIAEQAGAAVVRFDDGTPLIYNKKDLKNPWFIVSNGKY